MQRSLPEIHLQPAWSYEHLPDGLARRPLCPHDCKIALDIEAPVVSGSIAGGDCLHWWEIGLFCRTGSDRKENHSCIFSWEVRPIRVRRSPVIFGAAFDRIRGSRRGHNPAALSTNQKEESRGSVLDELERQKVVGYPDLVFCPRRNSPANDHDWVLGRPVTPPNGSGRFSDAVPRAVPLSIRNRRYFMSWPWQRYAPHRQWG